MAILGLMNAESFSASRFQSHRRQVFYYYPNGAAPLMGLLSLMKDEPVDDPTFNWYEKRLSENWLLTAAISGSIVLYKSVVTSAGKITSATAATADLGLTSGTNYAIKLAADPTNVYRIGHIIRYVASAITTSNAEEVIGRVIAVNGASDTPANVVAFMEVRTTANNVQYSLAANVSSQVTVIGSAYAEGIRDESSGIYNLPINPSNYTQIFRKPFSITGTALKTSSKFDEQGVYPDESKEASVDFAREMEWAFLFGEKNQIGSSTTSVTRFTGGILYFLRLWEAGSTYSNTAATADTDDTKRIINNTGLTVSLDLFMGWAERIFRISNNKSNEKLAFCGSGALLTLNKIFLGKTELTSPLPLKDTFGMDVRALLTPFGTIYLKTHPLMSQNSVLRYNMLVTDVPNLMYRYLRGRDMDLLTNRQDNDEDARKDEWFGECGLEVDLPESHLYIQNLVTPVP